ncbi:transglycosylase domain-containing protein [Amphibacillus jilinensis]|uniref:transglycosylase domain-containing protein n=1 Tax=Amphibacillus jilinensis TaxID=1216008 RepID=UPI00030AD3C0|nr:PBP1A family penicillin-binding protein [Amphibacillus jilinensis]
MEKLNRLKDCVIKVVKRPWIKWSAFVGLSILILSVVGFLFIIYGGGLIVDERDLVLPATTTVVTEDGEAAGRLYTENRQLVEFNQIPEHVWQAFIAVEDQRFYNHAGVDFRAVMRAVYRDVIAFDKVEGASTITQQLAKNLFLDNQQSWMRKTKEVMASIYLERHYTKNEILTLYLNQVYFGQGIYGVGTAAHYFFDKPIDELSITEGALLAGMVKGPNLYSPYNNEELALERRNLVLGQLQRIDYLETEEMLTLQGRTLNVIEQDQTDVPWIDDYLELVIREAESLYQISREELQRGGYQITVYMDTTAQQHAYEQIQDQQFFHGSQDNVEAAFVMIDQETGQLKAVIGGRDYAIGDQHRALSLHQPGSVMKPLAVYGPALTEGYQPYMLLDDSKQDYDGYTVRNIDEQYQGEVSMHEAVTVSKNTSAVWLLDQLGIETSKQYLSKMNITLPDEGLALGLGGLTDGLTPIQVAEGYLTFAHNGKWISAHTIAKIEDRHGQVIAEAAPVTEQVFTEQAAWDMLRMLENVVEEGTGQAGEFSKALAGKTGTTQHPHALGYAKDAWFAGITPDYVTAAWIGYDVSDAEHYLTKGSQSATELTKSILNAIDRDQSLTATFTVPDQVEDLADPIELPLIQDIQATYKWGGWRLVKGELSWSAPEDERIIYQVYEVNEQGEEQIGQVEGEASFTIVEPPVFGKSSYYIVPYNPLTGQSGYRSNIVTLSLSD